MRLRKIKNAQERLLDKEGLYIVNPQEFKGKWHKKFNNNNPIYIEIGMGKGKFIIEHAKRNPNINYIGIEKYDSVLIKGVEKASSENLTNIYFLNVDAINLNDYFKKGEVDKIYLNFSDPWPKSRHAKRRLTNEKFLKVYDVILNKKGNIEFKTDNIGLFEYSVMEFNRVGYDFLEFSCDLHRNGDDIVTTEYEDKFMKKGNPIYYIKIKK
ncbi:MAG: tRNA (guanosine(46)-N7)-methyltransferase TrmB [Bacilli bacterium]|nr:tRNA (guanosine(46)-N7)-methyltransferase TrmB [Bacilli bacterium]